MRGSDIRGVETDWLDGGGGGLGGSHEVKEKKIVAKAAGFDRKNGRERGA